MSQTLNIPSSPLLFEPGMEHLEENEAETDAGLEDTMRGIRETTSGIPVMQTVAYMRSRMACYSEP